MGHKWLGKPIEECNREELLQCIDWLTQRYSESISPQSVRAKILGMTEMLKHGEVYRQRV